MNRRQMLQLGAAALGSAYSPLAIAELAHDAPNKIAQWDHFELTLRGPSTGNPFQDVQLTATFSLDHRTVEVAGFYDGDGVYRIRFMPDTPGNWTYLSASTHADLRAHTGRFLCTPATADNHGPVNTAHQYHFQHADGAPFFPFGTTCYAYGFMGAPWEGDTLKSLRSTGFNKVRMCLLPKPLGHPLFALPFAVNADGSNDLSRLNPTYFQHVEKRILDLGRIGIQADVILFHPYDAWGYKSMPPAANDLYLRYAITRLSAYHNVWWSVANEYDLVKSKTMKDWDSYFHTIQQCDPYSHLRSIHHSRVQYDNSKPWVTHASLQEYDFNKAGEYREAWGKPILWDEMQYEGNIARRWGNLSPEEMTRRFWLAIISGTYGTHGETCITPPGQPVWSDGGILMGSSPQRIAFLRSLLERITKVGLNEFEGAYYFSAGTPNELYLYYFDTHCVGEYDFPLPLDIDFKCTLIDPWNMTANELPGVFRGVAKSSKSSGPIDENNPGIVGNHVKLSGKPYMAALFQRI
jgi:hypothetical protein